MLFLISLVIEDYYINPGAGHEAYVLSGGPSVVLRL